MKNNCGITLVALVITVVVMLILAGVAISAVVDGEGIFSRTNMVATEYKKQNIIEAIRTADLQLEIDKQFDNTIEKNIVNLLNKLEEISDINNEKYDIKHNNLDEATIIDPSTGIVIDIKILPDGTLDLESSVVDDISDAIKPEITYTLNPAEGSYADEVTITVTVREETKGIVKLQMPDNTEKTYDNQKEVIETYTVNKNGVYKFTAEGVNGRRISCYVYVRNAMNPADIQMTLVNPEATKEAQVKIVFDNNLPDLTNANKYQYSIGENNWQTATANQIVKVTQNGTVYARYFDGTVGHKTVSLNISNVDRLAPNEFNLTVKPSMNSIEVSGQTTDVGSEGTAAVNVGIRGYQFQLKDSTGKVLIDWTTEQISTIYTFNDLEKETEYKVSMRAIDKAGNVRDASNNNLIVNTVNNISIGQVNTGENMTFDGQTTGTYNNPIIPKGFAPINENGANWGTTNGWQYGLVIRDESGNEFVWVPVDGDVIKFERIDWGKGTSMSSCNEIIPYELSKSVNENGGFYIARYEAGKVGTIVVSKKFSNSWTNIDWNTSKTKSNEMYNSSNNGVKSTLIYGTQWDTTLKFIQVYGDKDINFVINSTGKGNYAGTNGGDTTTATAAPSGFLESFRKNNIYDMAGNVWEWTMEEYSGNVLRGGSWYWDGDSRPASYRAGGFNGYNSDWGFRVALYICR